MGRPTNGDAERRRAGKARCKHRDVSSRVRRPPRSNRRGVGSVFDAHCATKAWTGGKRGGNVDANPTRLCHAAMRGAARLYGGLARARPAPAASAARVAVEGSSARSPSGAQAAMLGRVGANLAQRVRRAGRSREGCDQGCATGDEVLRPGARSSERVATRSLATPASPQVVVEVGEESFGRPAQRCAGRLQRVLATAPLTDAQTTPQVGAGSDAWAHGNDDHGGDARSVIFDAGRQERATVAANPRSSGSSMSVHHGRQASDRGGVRSADIITARAGPRRSSARGTTTQLRLRANMRQDARS